MSYLSPFTQGIISWLQQLFVLPTIFYFTIALVIFTFGIGLYLTSTDFDLRDILNLLPKTIVRVQKSLDKKRISGLLLIVLGILGLFTFADELSVEASASSNSGGPSLYHCLDFPNIAGWLLNTNCGPANNSTTTIANNACNKVTNATACPSTYALNFAGTGPTASGQGTFVVPSAVGAFNCTGLTTTALTIKSTGKVDIWGEYSAASVNVTNWFMWVLLSIGPNAPSTSFGGTVCSTPATCRWISSMYLPVTGTANWFTVTFAQNSGTTFCPALTVGNTYYAWVDLEARSVNTGHVSLRNEIQNAGGLFMQEQM